MRKYRVWINQVNQTYVDVEANGPAKARLKAYAKWRREDAHAEITDVKEIEQEDGKDSK